MSFEDMAHSHVQRLLREGMELTEIKADTDGDYAFGHRGIGYWVSVLPEGHMIRVWAMPARYIKPTVGVLREVNDLNASYRFSHAYLQDGTLTIEAFLPLLLIDTHFLMAVCHEVKCSADRVGVLLSTVHGGTMPGPEWIEANNNEDSAA